MRMPWLHTLRFRLLIVTLIIVTVPIMLTGYMLKVKTADALLAEKQEKLFGLTRLLDTALGHDFEEVLAETEQTLSREEKIRQLNQRLSVYTDRIAAASPGVGVGYYSRELDAIITYGPSEEYAATVGRSIEANHPGRRVMQSGQQAVESGSQVRGRIMNAMLPISRDGKVIGYIWANELTDNVEAQLAVIERGIFGAVACGILVALSLSLGLTHRLVNEVTTIKGGLEEMQFDLRKTIAPLEGEMGEISLAINGMAQSLLNSRGLTENIMFSIADGIITVNNQGNITMMNRAAQELTGFAPEEVVGRFYKDMFQSHPEFHSWLLDTLESGANHIGMAMEYPVKHGTSHISASTTRLKNSREEIIGAVVVFKDLTEQHRLQEQVQRAEKLATLGELMAGVAHEIRNPLTAIKGFVQYLSETDSEEERQEYMPIISKEVDRINAVIEEMLYFSKPCPLRRRLLDFNAVVAATLLLVDNKARRGKVVFVRHLAEGLPEVEGDEEQLRQLLLNLVMNAVQATAAGGTVAVRTWRKAEQLCLQVSDNGSGILPENLAQVYDPFFTTKQNGTGLGLAVVQRILSSHGGRMELESVWGHGTTVLVYLPLTQGGSKDGRETIPHFDRR
ncbi:two-component system sensor histidine kinase AtoS [Azotosporobacter soli]|uniref:two-component system sensor histidine kinase AtoS n=1 Tax=Azotosporobacter soli TaxID=3055040 RepID=UPI0031FF1AA5